MRPLFRLHDFLITNAVVGLAYPMWGPAANGEPSVQRGCSISLIDHSNCNIGLSKQITEAPVAFFPGSTPVSRLAAITPQGRSFCVTEDQYM